MTEKFAVTGLFPGVGAGFFYGATGGDPCDERGPVLRYVVGPVFGPIVMLIANGGLLWWPTIAGFAEAASSTVDGKWCGASMFGSCRFTCIRDATGAQLSGSDSALGGS